MVVGYSDDHAGDVYRMWMLDSKKILTSRDIIRLNKLYKEYMAEPHEREGSNTYFVGGVAIKQEPQETPVIAEEVTSNEVEEEVIEADAEVQEEDETPVPRLGRELRNLLQTSYNNVIEQVEVCMMIQEDDEPDYKSAIMSSNKANWKATVKEEFNNFKEKQVW